MAPKYNRKKQAQSKADSKGNSKLIYIIIGVLAIVVIIAGVYFIGGFGSSKEPVTPTPTPNPTPATENTKVLLETSMGEITIQLFDDKPVTTQNFLKLVALGKYDNTVFHRVLKDFMIQGGVLNKKGELIDASWPTINDEIGSNNHNYKYTIAMAKTNETNSATTSFFINTVDNSEMVYDNGNRFDDIYTAFGKVIKGQDVVDAISKVPVTTNNGEKSQPTQTVTLISAKIIS
ncbi:MAG: peptidylprolyl isomerase [Nitrososphaerota archaeon]|jgi:cyclophilin family peptidyl-prolyl cis-trans isomerase|nr:peptidylprolyl isomerase [Nitrososphaerota archaeon]